MKKVRPLLVAHTPDVPEDLRREHPDPCRDLAIAPARDAQAQRQQTPLLQRWVLRHGVPLPSFPPPLVPEHDRQVWIPCWRALAEAATNRAFRISPNALGEPCAPLISLAKIAGEGIARAGTSFRQEVCKKVRRPASLPSR